jgi:Txe/YoeB family toxin of toxin-antitoxin system
MFELIYINQAKKDAKKLVKSNLKSKAKKILAILEKNPFLENPPYERLIGDLEGAFSRRINIQHRIVYQVYPKRKIVKIIRMWTHYS